MLTSAQIAARPKTSAAPPVAARVTNHFLRLFRWHVLRDLAQHPLLAALNVATVALGVALYLAIQVANQSANHAFAASVDVVAGKAQLEINAPDGTLPETVLPKVIAQPGVAAATPIVRGFLTVPKFPGEYLDLLGIDIFTNIPFRTFELTDFATETFDLQAWLRGPRTIALSEAFAREHHLRAGDRIDVQHNGRTVRLTIGFLIRGERSGLAPDAHFAAMDIGWAQELLGRSGTLDSISLRLTTKGDAKTVARALRVFLPADVTVAPPARRTEEVDKMLAGFQLNLTAMSLVSLLVGMFLIYNTVEASVLRRRKEIGILRSLGATRTEVCALFLGEAAALGLVGVAAGMAGGYFLARALVGAVAGTISQLYVLVSEQQIVIAPWVWLSAIAVGLGAVLVAAWLPARGAALSEPVEALRDAAQVGKATHLSRGWIFAGLCSLGGAALVSILALKTGPPWLGFGAALLVLAGFSLAAPETITRFSRALRPRFRSRIEPRLAAQNLSRALLRNSVTIASLAAAVAMTIGVSVMVFSFRQTVTSWIDQTLIADLFIGPAANEIAGPTSFMPPDALQFLKSDPSVAAVDSFRAVDLPFRGQTISLGAISGGNRRNLRFLRGANDEIMRRFYRERCVIVSESFARRYHLRDGETLTLPTPAGMVGFPIAGIFYDYTNDQGLVFLSAKNYRQLWHDDRVHSVGVYLRRGASAEIVAQKFRERFSRDGEFSIYSNRALRSRIFEIFDQTFAVTYVLRTIAIVVAVIGIFLGLTTLVTERRYELGVLRAIGASAVQVRRLLLWESGMIGLLASVLGIASGLCLAVVLTGVINRAFFGWTIQLAFPFASLALTPIWIVAAAIFAGWIPAWRAGRLNIATAVRSE
ncbi:MAG TPA: FtsX-like permease family protein [Chthoniobacterales bacterium]